MTLDIKKTLILYFLSLEYYFCCGNCRKNKNNKLDDNQNLNNNQQNKKEEDNDNNNNNDNNVEIIKNDDVYVKKLINNVKGEIAKKIYIFIQTFKSKKREEDFFKEDDPKLKDDYFNNNYLEINIYGGNIFYVLFDKKTDDIICLLTINDKCNEKITINNIEFQPQKTIHIATFQCHYKYRYKGYGKLLMLYVLQQFKKNTGFYLVVNGAKEVMTSKNLSEFYKKFGFKLMVNIEYNEEDDDNYNPGMAFIKNDNKTYYKNKEVKVIIEER